MGRLFGTDGVRAVAGGDLSGELAFRLGRAAVVALTELGERRPKITLGRDTRASGEFLEAAISAGICSAGGDVLSLGVTTTPAVAFLTRDMGAQAGAVISASHNPAEYNGIKFFAESGYKLPDDVEDEVERLVDSGEGPRPTGREIGRIRPVHRATERYLAHLEASAGGRLDGMHVVVDSANGAASTFGPELLRRLGAKVSPINDEPDGWNINDGCGATTPEAVSLAVVEAEADAGVAFDGDADRAIFADRDGAVIDGDQVLAACAVSMHRADELPKSLVVTTVMANLGLRLALEDAGISILETRVGDRYVLEEMLRSGAALGGEQSGHVIFLDHATTGDGLLTAVRFLTMAAARGAPVAEVAAIMRRYPQVLRNVEVADRGGLEASEEIREAIRRAEKALDGRGRVLVRASGTEPLVRVMVEAQTEDEAARFAQDISTAVSTALS
ncbi:MAG TPA: phosphoglucosamine mutase [Actinomycetota bacterium]|nr:phosphoglucosamine mutase [Actinomycetota bacterium]